MFNRCHPKWKYCLFLWMLWYACWNQQHITTLGIQGNFMGSATVEVHFQCSQNLSTIIFRHLLDESDGCYHPTSWIPSDISRFFRSHDVRRAPFDIIFFWMQMRRLFRITPSVSNTDKKEVTHLACWIYNVIVNVNLQKPKAYFFSAFYLIIT